VGREPRSVLERQPRRRSWSGWSSWRRSAACISLSGSRSRRSSGGRATVVTRSGARCARAKRLAIGVCCGRRSSIPSAKRCIGCCGGATAAGHADPRAHLRAGLRGLEVDPRRLPARGQAAVPCRGRAPSSASRTGRARSVSRPQGAVTGDPDRLWAEPPRRVLVACLPYSRAGAGTLVFSKEAPDLL